MTPRYEIYVRASRDTGGYLHGCFDDIDDARIAAYDLARTNWAEARVYDTKEGGVVLIAKGKRYAER